MMNNTPLDLQNQISQPKYMDVKRVVSEEKPQKKTSSYRSMKLAGAVLSGLTVLMVYSTVTHSDLGNSLKGSIRDFMYTSDLNTQSGEEEKKSTEVANKQTTDTIDATVAPQNTGKNINTLTQSSAPVTITEVSVQVDHHTIEAGENMIVTSSEVNPNTQITFIIEKDQIFAEFSAIANARGIAVANIPGEVFTESGKYNISVKSFGTYVGKGIVSIQVTAKEIFSEIFSEAVIEENVLKVSLRDEYNNPITQHTVQIVSNNNLTIQPSSKKTDIQGNALFSIKNLASDITVNIVDATSGMMFQETITLSPENSPSAWQKLLFIPRAFAQETASSFLIKEIKTDVSPNESLTFKLEAVDSQGNIAQSYAGEVVFESTDSEAELPSNVVFSSNDNGSKTIIGKLSLKTAGTQTLTVSDRENSLVFGSININVLGDVDSSGEQTEVVILTPLSGETKDRPIDVMGSAGANNEVKLLDNNGVIGTTRADKDGIFLFESVQLTDGNHVITAQSNGVTSEKVSIIMDTESPDIDNISITPTVVKINDPILITLESENNLNAINITLDGNTIKLNKDASGKTYTGTMNAPSTPGIYQINAELVDQNNNTTSYNNVQSITVTASVVNTSNPDPANVIPSQLNTSAPTTTTDTGPRETFLMVALFIAVIVAWYYEEIKEKLQR